MSAFRAAANRVEYGHGHHDRSPGRAGGDPAAYARGASLRPETPGLGRTRRAGTVLERSGCGAGRDQPARIPRLVWPLAHSAALLGRSRPRSRRGVFTSRRTSVIVCPNTSPLIVLARLEHLDLLG